MTESELAKKYPKVSGGGGLFLKLEDGQTVKVRLVSDPIYFDNEFQGQLSSRFAWVVWNHDEEKAQIWATNGATYNSIKDLVLDDEYGDPSGYDIKITRTGTQQQTRYSVRPGAKRYELTEDQLKACKDIDAIKVIDKSESASHVMYLEEHREEKKAAPAESADEQVNDGEESQAEGEEPINMDDIPF